MGEANAPRPPFREVIARYSSYNELLACRHMLTSKRHLAPAKRRRCEQCYQEMATGGAHVG